MILELMKHHYSRNERAEKKFFEVGFSLFTQYLKI